MFCKIPFQEYSNPFCVLILRPPYGIVHDANEMRMTWAAKCLENVLIMTMVSNKLITLKS